MITRHAWPGYAPSPELAPPMCHVHPLQRGQAAPRGPGLVGGGAVLLVGIPSTPGGSSGYGYLGMDIADAASWPRPFNPQPTNAWFVRPQEAR